MLTDILSIFYMLIGGNTLATVLVSKFLLILVSVPVSQALTRSFSPQFIFCYHPPNFEMKHDPSRKWEFIKNFDYLGMVIFVAGLLLAMSKPKPIIHDTV